MFSQIPPAIFMGVLTRLVLFGSPLLLPVAFALYGTHQGKFTLRLLMAFVTCECIAVGSLTWVLRNMDD